MVEPSLLRLAADRGVTICFADLDGADGLWVPEERTVLVNRALSEREVAEIIEHELGHVAIDDQHADLDAGIVRRPPGPSRAWAAALTAAACFAVVGGVTAGMASREQPTVRPEPVVAPSPPPLTGPAGPPQVVETSVGSDGRIVYRTVTLTPRPPAAPAASVSGPPAATATRATASATRATPTAPPPPRTSVKPPLASPSPSATPPTVGPTPTDTPTPAPTATVAGPIQDGSGG